MVYKHLEDFVPVAKYRRKAFNRRKDSVFCLSMDGGYYQGFEDDCNFFHRVGAFASPNAWVSSLSVSAVAEKDVKFFIDAFPAAFRCINSVRSLRRLFISGCRLCNVVARAGKYRYTNVAIFDCLDSAVLVSSALIRVFNPPQRVVVEAYLPPESSLNLYNFAREFYTPAREFGIVMRNNSIADVVRVSVSPDYVSTMVYDLLRVLAPRGVKSVFVTFSANKMDFDEETSAERSGVVSLTLKPYSPKFVFDADDFGQSFVDIGLRLTYRRFASFGLFSARRRAVSNPFEIFEK